MSYNYHQLLEYVYFEGYANSYEEAEYLLNQLNDEEYEELNESRRKLAHSFPLRPSEKLSVANIGRMNRGDFSVPPKGKVKPEPEAEPEEQKPRRRRRTDMSKVIVAHYLFDEGYAETIESAELIAESISDEWARQILDEDDSWKEKNFKPLSNDKKQRVTGFLNSQMIKLKDYSNQADIAQDELKNPDYSKPPRVKIGTLLKKMKTGSRLMSNAQQARRRTTEREEGQNNIRKFKREDLEYILDTLISEGFAVDYDSAGCILESMSDEWLDTILEVKGGGKVSFTGNTSDRGMPINPSDKLYRKKIKVETDMENEENRIRRRNRAPQPDEYNDLPKGSKKSQRKGGRRDAAASRETRTSPIMQSLQQRFERLSGADDNMRNRK